MSINNLKTNLQTELNLVLDIKDHHLILSLLKKILKNLIFLKVSIKLLFTDNNYFCEDEKKELLLAIEHLNHIEYNINNVEISIRKRTKTGKNNEDKKNIGKYTNKYL